MIPARIIEVQKTTWSKETLEQLAENIQYLAILIRRARPGLRHGHSACSSEVYLAFWIAGPSSWWLLVVLRL